MSPSAPRLQLPDEEDESDDDKNQEKCASLLPHALSAFLAVEEKKQLIRGLIDDRCLCVPTQLEFSPTPQPMYPMPSQMPLPDFVPFGTEELQSPVQVSYAEAAAITSPVGPQFGPESTHIVNGLPDSIPLHSYPSHVAPPQGVHMGTNCHTQPSLTPVGQVPLPTALPLQEPKTTFIPDQTSSGQQHPPPAALNDRHGCCSGRNIPQPQLHPSTSESGRSPITSDAQYPSSHWRIIHSHSSPQAPPVPFTMADTAEIKFMSHPHSRPLEMPQTTMYHIPSGLATSENPITAESQAELQRADTYRRQTVPINAMSGITGVAAPPAEASCSGEKSFTSHICNCGDTCACTGCPVHPDNPTMKAKVQDLAENYLDSDPDSSGTSRPQSLCGGPPSQFDPSQAPHFSPSLSVNPEVDWSPFGHLSSELNHAEHTQPNSAYEPEAQDFGHPLFPSSDYLHFRFDLSPLPECNAPPSIECHCSSGCGCSGCLAHTGHINEENFETLG